MPEADPKDKLPDPDGWSRFESAVDAALHSPAKHREGKHKEESSLRPKRRRRAETSSDS